MWEVHSSDKIRIKDIAERSGVSVGTVDRVLHTSQCIGQGESQSGDCIERNQLSA